MIRHALATVVLFIMSTCAVASDEPLSIKGVSLGDTVDKMTVLGACMLDRGGMCVGRTTYGPISNADFMVSHVAGRVESVGITYPAARSAEVLAGLTERFGQPQSGTCANGSPGCYSWKRDSTELLLLIDTGKSGAVLLHRSAPRGNF